MTRGLLGLRLAVPGLGMLALAGCMTENSYGGAQPDTALIRGSSPLSFLAPKGNSASIQAVNGTAVSASQAAVRLPPGHYTFSVSCMAQGLLGANYWGKQNITFDAEAGHVYQLDADGPESGSDQCAPFVYDATGGRDAYDETAHIHMDGGDAKNWHSLDAGAHAGHTIADVVPRGQSSKDWQQMIEIESWLKPMYAGTADSFFQQQKTNALNSCPGTQVTVVTPTPDDVTYELQAPAGCAVRSQVGRFLTGKYGIYHAVYISRAPLDDAATSQWLKTMQTTTVISAK